MFQGFKNKLEFAMFGLIISTTSKPYSLLWTLLFVIIWIFFFPHNNMD